MLIALDTETLPFSARDPAPPVVCVSLAWRTEGEVQTLLVHPTDALVEQLLLADDVLVGHNIAYDMACLHRYWPDAVLRRYDSGVVWDTMLGEKLGLIATGRLRGSEGKGSLAELAGYYLGRELPKGEDTYRLRYGELADVQFGSWNAEAREYALNDARATLEVAEALRLEQFPDLPAQCRQAYALHRMAVRGMVVDQAAVAAEKARLTAELAELERQLAECGLVVYDKKRKPTRKVAELRERLEGVMVASGVPEALWERTPTGALSTAADSLEVWAGFDGALRTWHEYGHTQKMLSTYIEALEAAGDDPIHPFVDTLRETGRVSMRAPNLQNLPRKGALRECFTPRPGRVYVSADYDTAELRALAQTCLDVLGWSRLAETYQADPAADPHLHFAASMLGIAYGDAKVRYHEGDVAVVGARQRAKAANFGFPGGMGAAKFVLAQRKQGAAFTVDEAFALRNAWFSQWPEIPEYFKWVNDQGDVFTTRRSQRTRGGCGFCDGANNGFQAVIADVAKTAAWYAERAGLYVVNFLHDELIIECAEQEVGRCARVLVDCMVTAGAEFLPDVPVRAEAKAMRRWSKAAKRATNDRGELVAWG